MLGQKFFSAIYFVSNVSVDIAVYKTSFWTLTYDPGILRGYCRETALWKKLEVDWICLVVKMVQKSENADDDSSMHIKTRQSSNYYFVLT
jgi:hypothetical protein